MKERGISVFSKETPVDSSHALGCTVGLLEIKPLGMVQASLDVQLPHAKGNELPLGGDPLCSPAAHIEDLAVVLSGCV